MTYLVASADVARFSSTVALSFGASENVLNTNGNDSQGLTASASGNAATLSMSISSWGSATSIKVAIYDEDALVETVVISSSEGTGVISVALAGTTAITSGNLYRFAVYSTSGLPLTLDSDTGGLTHRDFSSSGDFTNPVDPLPSCNFVGFNEFYFAIQDAPVGGLTLDSTPTDNRVEEQRSVTVSTPAVVPTDLNVQIKHVDDTGPEAGNYSVTGSDPYVISYTFPRSTAKKFDATGYPLYIEVAAESVTSSNVPFLPVSTQRFVDLSSPVATAGTYGIIYAGATAATGDQRVHDIVTTSESIPLDADGAAYGAEQDFWALRSQPATTQTATHYRIDSDGTVDVEDTITFVVETPVTDSGILRNILRPPLKAILRNPIK